MCECQGCRLTGFTFTGSLLPLVELLITLHCVSFCILALPVVSLIHCTYSSLRRVSKFPPKKYKNSYWVFVVCIEGFKFFTSCFPSQSFQRLTATTFDYSGHFKQTSSNWKVEILINTLLESCWQTPASLSVSDASWPSSGLVASLWALWCLSLGLSLALPHPTRWGLCLQLLQFCSWVCTPCFTGLWSGISGLSWGSLSKWAWGNLNDSDFLFLG